MDRPLSERLWSLLNDASEKCALNSNQLCTIDEARALARRVEDAPCVPVIDGGMMIRPFFQYGRFDLPDDGENPATKEAHLLGQFVGQRVRIVPEAGQGVK